MKRLTTIMAAIGLALGAGLAARAEVSAEITAAAQRWPWNGKFDITYTVSGVPSGEEAKYETTLTAEDRMTSKTYTAVHVTGETHGSNGVHHVVWDMSADGLTFDSTNLFFDVSVKEPPPLYYVIDLSGGMGASAYPVTTLTAAPAGGWTDEYKTTKLVLRRIEPGTFTMGDQVHGGSTYANIALTKPYYIGVFEVTQRQWELVMGTKPSYFSNSSYYATRPVERVSYNMIRGSSSGAGWPGSAAVDADSFVGKLRAKTGIDEFDLPTEAQWEYAARSGTSTDYGNGTNYSNYDSDANMNVVGRYWYNGDLSCSQSCSTSAGTAKVGSYAANKWGLYDMHGNVWEWCLDWYGSLTAGTSDPEGSSSGSSRGLRGGSWGDYALHCTSSCRLYGGPSNGFNYYGFRLSRTLSK